MHSADLRLRFFSPRLDFSLTLHLLYHHHFDSSEFAMYC